MINYDGFILENFDFLKTTTDFLKYYNLNSPIVSKLINFVKETENYFITGSYD